MTMDSENQTNTMDRYFSQKLFIQNHQIQQLKEQV